MQNSKLLINSKLLFSVLTSYYLIETKNNQLKCSNPNRIKCIYIGDKIPNIIKNDKNLKKHNFCHNFCKY